MGSKMRGNLHMTNKALNFNRPNDMFYDPLFIVSGPKDHYKAARLAVMRTAKVSVCPIFPSMFTDLPHVPKHQVIFRSDFKVPEYQSRHSTDSSIRQLDVGGVDRYKYFQAAPDNFNSRVPFLSFHIATATDQLEETEKAIFVERVGKMKAQKKIQTIYRESSAQTSPWEPNYKIMDDSDPEILKLDFLKWGAGLPVGMHEIKLIERARMKRQWEKALPPISDSKSLKKRRDIIDAMEREEWAFREQEIQDIQNLRMELLERMLQELLENTQTRSERKMEMFCKMKLAEREEKLAKLKRESTRQKRRLDFNHRGIIMKYRPVNVVDEHADYKSELYAPMMRHGVHPKRWHQVIDDHLKKYRPNYKGVEKYKTLPTWLEKGPKIDDSSVKLPGTRLCIRETKWTNPVLKELHLELKSLRQITKKKCSLRIRVPPKEEPLPTPEVEYVDDSTEENNQGLILVQSVIRGRAAQILVFEGRDNCRELIQELRSTHGVLNKQKIEVFRQKLEVKYDQREEVFCITNSNKIQEALNRLQGTLVGTLLDFLNKELRRLLDERKAHALGIMAERERERREAAEAGRRQYELRRRLEHDEMFKQIVKVHQDTVDMYLEDIITDGIEFASKDEAKQYVTRIAEKIDKEIAENEQFLKDNVLEQEEMIAELVHHFVLPEVEKAIVRERIKKRQQTGLKSIHNELFETIEGLPKPPPKCVKKKKKRRVREEEHVEEEPIFPGQQSGEEMLHKSVDLEQASAPGLVSESISKDVKNEEEEEEESEDYKQTKEEEEVCQEDVQEEQETDKKAIDASTSESSENMDFVQIHKV